MAGVDLGRVSYVPKTAYDEGVTYSRLDVVSYQGSSYVSLINNNIGNVPVEGVSWSIVAQKGDKGDTGEQGIQGIQGIEGPKGDKGDKGNTGDQGVQGLKGDTGDQGVQGLKGDTGDQGVQGLKGDTGAKGDKGDPGQDGVISIDAPEDGKTYGRKNLGWVEVSVENSLDITELYMKFVESASGGETHPSFTITPEMLDSIINAHNKRFISAYILIEGELQSFIMRITYNTANPDFYYEVNLIAPSASGGVKGYADYTAITFSVQENNKQCGVNMGGLRFLTNGQGDKFLSDNGEYKEFVKAIVPTDVFTVSSLSQLSPTKYSQIYTYTSATAQPINFAGTPAEGFECMLDIKNSTASNITQAIPNASGWQTEDTSVVLPAGKVTSVSIRRAHGINVVRI